MTIPSLMIYPSVWMQKSFFQIAEQQREVKIGEHGAKEGFASQVSIRVMAAFHGALQCVYATLAIIPVWIATTITIILTPNSTGFVHRDGTVLERMAIALRAAFLSVYAPVVASAAALWDIRQLSSVRSCAVSYPILKHGELLALTLPLLADLSHYYYTLQAIQDWAEGPDVWYKRWAKEAFLDIAGSIPIHALLKEIDRVAFRWRIAFPKVVLNQERHSISHYDQAFDITSVSFLEAVAKSVACGRRNVCGFGVVEIQKPSPLNSSYAQSAASRSFLSSKYAI
jgi:hypothetical protein